MEKLSMASQEALEVLIDAKHCRNAEHERQVNEAIKILQELVNKATPKKLNNEENHYVFETYDLSHVSGDCPNCGRKLYYDEYDEDLNYCQYCGQAFDWSEDERN